MPEHEKYLNIFGRDIALRCLRPRNSGRNDAPLDAARTAQLRAHGIAAPVVTNQGPKGAALKRIVDEYRPNRAVFIDDLAHHHASAAETLPDISRLHFCGEPAIAPHVPCALEAGHAHARIDAWDEALPWLLETLHGG